MKIKVRITILWDDPSPAPLQVSPLGTLVAHTNSPLHGPLSGSHPSTLLAAHFTSCVTLKTLFINLNGQQLNSLAGVTNTETVESSQAPLVSARLCLDLIHIAESFQFNRVWQTLCLNSV